MPGTGLFSNSVPTSIAAPPNEQVVFENEFGRVTDRRLVFESGRIGRSHARRDIPLRSISSVEYAANSYPIAAAFFAVGGIVLLEQRTSSGIVLALFGFVIALLLFKGPESIIIGLVDGDKQCLEVGQFRTARAQEYANALRAELFKNAP